MARSGTLDYVDEDDVWCPLNRHMQHRLSLIVNLVLINELILIQLSLDSSLSKLRDCWLIDNFVDMFLKSGMTYDLIRVTFKIS